MQHARIQDGIVVEIIAETEHALSERFHPDYVATLIPASGEVETGMSWDGSAFGPPPAAAVPPLDLVAYAANRRWQREVGGITVGDVPVATDDRSKIMIVGARAAAAADPGWTTVWLGSDGVAYPLDAEAMVAISDAVQRHVSASFAAFSEVKAAIDAGTLTTAAMVDAAFTTLLEVGP